MSARRRVRITVHGRLSEHFAPAFEGMTLRQHGHDTDLVGEIVDQAQLYGLLARIRDLGLQLERLSLLPNEGLPHAAPERREHEEH